MLQWGEVKILWGSIILIGSFRLHYFFLTLIVFFNLIDTINNIFIHHFFIILLYIFLHLFLLVFGIISSIRLNNMLFIFRDIRESSHISLQDLYEYLLSIIWKLNHFLVQKLINDLIKSTFNIIIILFSSLYSICIFH